MWMWRWNCPKYAAILGVHAFHYKRILRLKLNNSKLLTSFAVFLLSSLSYAGADFANSEALNGFDQACSVFEEASHMDVNNATLATYLNEGINNRVDSHEVREAYSIIFHLEPAERYSVFQEGAEESLGHKWHCEPMQKLLSKTSK